jgi:hypothetical protein
MPWNPSEIEIVNARPTPDAMTIIERGTTRFVVVVGKAAVKFARDERGRRCNLYEAKVWEENREDPNRGPHLCPVLWCSSDGEVLVMVAADPLPSDITIPYDWADEWWSASHKGSGDDFPGEPKAADWGLLDGRVVLLDYSNPAL